MPDTPDNLPGNGFFGWLGRQIGHVAKAVKTNVAAPEQPEPKVLYRDCTVEEKESPTDPKVKLRRTVIDEVVEETQSDGCGMQNEGRDGSREQG